jgi:hypothetical protein
MAQLTRVQLQQPAGTPAPALRCEACMSMIPPTTDHLIIAPSWRRCSHAICGACWGEIMHGAATTIRAL